MPSVSPDCFDIPDRLMPVEEAVALLCARLGPVTPVEDTPLAAALGRVLADDVVSDIVVPPDDNSAMDGYAVHHSDLAAEGPTTLPVTLRIAAGHPADRPLPPGEAARIFTGAPMPDGPDTVVMQEQTTEGPDGTVTIAPGQTRGANVRPAGADVTVGQRVLEAGRRLTPVDLAMAAHVGRSSLPVYRPVRVAVFTTGDEIVEPGEPLPPGSLYNSNRRCLVALLQALGANVIDMGNLPDQPQAIRDALAEAADASDLVLTSGGVSVGGEDHVKDAVAAHGALSFWRLAIKPGKPLAFGTVRGKPFLGLPGNPVSTFVTFCLVGRTVVLRLMGVDGAQLTPTPFAVRAGFAETRKTGRRDFPRVRLRPGPDGIPVAQLFPLQSSNLLTSITRSDGLVSIGPDVQEVREGDILPFLSFDSLLT